MMQMQGLHHQQQQIAALLSVALPKDESSSSSSTNQSEEDDSSRLAAITSLHRAILYPHNSLLVTHSASFLSQGFSQLLADKSYSVRQAAAIAYGALCAVLCSIPIASNGRQNQIIIGTLIDRFIGWALPLLNNVAAGDAVREMALEGLREFLNIGDVGAVERYALPILKACQELLEDERTSLSVLHRLLGVLTIISLKFFRCFQPHFVDIVDLLLGWAMVPDLAESDRHVITDSFLQFHKHWGNNMQFSLGLLSKFLGDMDVLLQDGSPGTIKQCQRLLTLLSCFSTVLQSTASGLLEINLLEQITEPLSKMLPLLLGCLSMVGKKFGWSKWIGDSWRCLTLLAEILGESFSSFYPQAVDILFQSLENPNQLVQYGKITPFQVHGVIKTNLQLLSLQKLGLLPSSVQKLLQFDGPISLLRLHPNHLVTGGSAATYIFLLQHGNNEAVEQAVTSLIEELELLKSMLGESLYLRDEVGDIGTPKTYSKLELFALIKFDLKVLLTCVPTGGGANLIGQPEIDAVYANRSAKLVSSIIKKFNPFDFPILGNVELQVTVVRTLDRLTKVELLRKCALRKYKCGKDPSDAVSEKFPNGNCIQDGLSLIIFEHLRKYTMFFVKALHISSPFSVKLETLQWVHNFCDAVIGMYEHSEVLNYPCEAFGYVDVVENLVFSVLEAASDREPKVRSHVAVALEMLLQAKLIHPTNFYAISAAALERLGDPDKDIKDAFLKLLFHVLPVTMYVCGLYVSGSDNTCKPGIPKFGNRTCLEWKQIFSLRQLSKQLQSKQLVSILSYISQRWKVPLSSWIQRLIHTCCSSKDSSFTQHEEAGNLVVDSLWLDIKLEDDILERISSVNIIAGAWWAIHEAARYCITTRLRTNLGGPTQTFAALERMLLDIAHVLQLDMEQGDGNLNVIGPSYARLLPMRLLLDFVEALKKNVYNAYEGSMVLPCVSRQSSLFFRANKKVCEEWFSRICEPMMNAGLALQCHDATIHYCSLRLQELSNLVAASLKEKSRIQATENLHNVRGRFSGDVLRILRHIALALCKNHEPEALIGLLKWVNMTFSFLFTEENQIVSHSGIFGPFAWITGLVYQAEGHYEKAAAHFIYLLQTEDSINSLGSEGVQFAIARIIESYTAVSDWNSLECWLLELQTLRAKHVGKSFSGALTMAGNEVNAIHALARFDEGDFQAAWAALDLTPKSSSELTLDPQLALQRSEQMLLQAMLLQIEGKVDKVSQEMQKAKSMLDEVVSILPLDGLEEAAAYVNHLNCIFSFEESCKLGSQDKKLQQLLSSYIQVVQSPIKRVNQDCSLWLKVFRVYRTILPNSLVTLKLCINLTSLARKQRNLMLANRLHDYLKDHIANFSKGSFHDHVILSLQFEGILLLHSENKFEDAFTNLWTFVRPCMISSPCVSSEPDNNVLKAKACLKLSKWLQRGCSTLNMENIIFKILSDFNLIGYNSLGEVAQSFNNDGVRGKLKMDLTVAELVGTATKASTLLCPTMGKSWITYASWCFSQARASLSGPPETALQSCTFSTSLDSQIVPGRFKLSEEELVKVKSIIMQLFQKTTDANELNEGAQICEFQFESTDHPRNENYREALVHQVVNIIEAAAGAPGAEISSGDCISAALTLQLQKCFLYANIDIEEAILLSLVDVWWSLRKRRVSLYGHAAQAFINYLSQSSSKHCDGPLTGSDALSRQKTVSYTLRATLYILHILLNFGLELKDVLEPALSTVPLLPWQEITPQLFARLSNHPERGVRKQLEGLLVMLAKLSPCSIVYPTLVDVNAYEEKTSEELQHILACLSMLYPRLIQDVGLMVKDLENVTVLWEELWLSTLQDLHSDVMRRINLLKEEAQRIAKNVTLSHNEKNKINAAKYSAMMAPIVVALERRLASTSKKAETPHEIWFHKEYMEQIKSAISNFKVPPASTVTLGDVWRSFDIIVASLVSYQRKSSISLGEVAPHLALLSSSDVPMPGLEKQITLSESEEDYTTTLQGIVTIASFSEQIAILSTKTKPKKLVLLGSDGQTYTYLLKGREDLRLDARIMQLLQAVNGFLLSSPSTRGQSLGIRYYSVTPISGRAGLIQWVDNVTSIYSVFKSWQTRLQLAQLSAMGANNMKTTEPPPVPRPSDMFYGKIIPALKEKGIRRVISRRDWPHEVKRKVLLDLMKEAPKNLLHQEFWCASEGFKAFSSKSKRFSGSVAAMSMVGHILGLGDRHLDNILVDFCDGDIVHIDYNVCFDKGQRLKIPEIVPFRLTQTIESALGLTGMEGTFRANCEAVLDVLKKNKDILLMLLEAFVWDPLVEWTRGDFHDDAAVVGEERKGMELAVSLSLFASRVQEIRVPLQEHHDILLTALPTVQSALERFTNVLNDYEIVSACFYRADQERLNLVLHETSAKSMVAEVTCNSEKARASLEIQAREFSQAKALVTEIAQEAATWTEQHGRIVDALRNRSVQEINTFIKLAGMDEAFSLTSAVLVAGVPLTIVPEPTQVQCRDIDIEVSQLMNELDQGLSSAVSAVQAYSLALQRVLPLNYLSTSLVHSWAQILNLAANTISSDILSLAKRQAADIVSRVHMNELGSVKPSYDDLCLKVEQYAKEIEKVEEECTELVSSIGSEIESRAKDRLLAAFMKYMQSAGLQRKGGVISSMQFGMLSHDCMKESASQVEIEQQEKVLMVFNIAVCSLYNDVKRKIHNILNCSTGGRDTDSGLQANLGTTFSELEEQIEKCVLVAWFVDELQQYIGVDITSASADISRPKYLFQRNWASVFKNSLLSCKSLTSHMIEVVLPNVIRSIISFNSEVMDAFGSLSQVRGSIDTVLEQLVEVEKERTALVELEQNYFVKVGLITEQQLALEEAALKGRDHLSWEDAEELASQEEACRAQLDKLHQTWNQKDIRTSSLMKTEAGIRSTLVSSERHFQSLISSEEDGKHFYRGKALLSVLAQPFSELESIDKVLSSFDGPVASCSCGIFQLADVMNSNSPMSDYIWKFSGMLKSHCFFVWKVAVIDSYLDSCIRDAASYADQSLGFQQLVNIVKKKLEIQLQNHIEQYLKERVAPVLLTRLDEAIEILKQMTDTTKEVAFDEAKLDLGAVQRVQVMLEEYCNAHETVRAARSAASLMDRQANELKEALLKTSLEIVLVEWMHDVVSNPLDNYKLIPHKCLGSDDNLLPVILNLSRPKLLESLQSSVTKVARSLDCLQVCERSSVTAEGQLERAMGWACGGPNTTAVGNNLVRNSGIPSEFHDHLMRRRQLLWEAREKASEIIKFCMSILEFESSRDGIFHTRGEFQADGQTWQQTYLNALTRLDVTYNSFTHTEQEWKLAQISMESASNDLFSATNELSIASVKSKSASGDLQSTLVAMRDCAYEVSIALSAFGRVTRSHTALTSECGSMLEEVLAITEGLHDVHSLGKEAAALHSSLMGYLSKTNAILIPLESVLSKDVDAMTDAMTREQETKLEISPIHGQAIYQSYYLRVQEAYEVFKPLVPSLTFSVKEVHSILTRLARTASLHAGNLHKALEGLGDNQEAESQDINFSRPNLAVDDTNYNNEGEVFSKSVGETDSDILDIAGLSLHDKGWISPPDSIHNSSSESGATSAEASATDSFDFSEGIEQLLLESNGAAGAFSETVETEISFYGHSKPKNLDDNCGDLGSMDEHLKAVESAHVETSYPLETSNFGPEGEASSLNPEKVEESNDETLHNTDASGRVNWGKNGYATSVLRRVEMKLDGRDIVDNREISVAEQVDHLLKQATSVDNLCNMYEGWTPWI